MRKIALLSASTLVLALGLASASAEPRTADVMNHGQTGVSQTYAPNATVREGRAAAIENQASAADLFDNQLHRAGR